MFQTSVISTSNLLSNVLKGLEWTKTTVWIYAFKQLLKYTLHFICFLVAGRKGRLWFEKLNVKVSVFVSGRWKRGVGERERERERERRKDELRIWIRALSPVHYPKQQSYKGETTNGVCLCVCVCVCVCKSVCCCISLLRYIFSSFWTFLCLQISPFHLFAHCSSLHNLKTCAVIHKLLLYMQTVRPHSLSCNTILVDHCLMGCLFLCLTQPTLTWSLVGAKWKKWMKQPCAEQIRVNRQRAGLGHMRFVCSSFPYNNQCWVPLTTTQLFSHINQVAFVPVCVCSWGGRAAIIERALKRKLRCTSRTNSPINEKPPSVWFVPQSSNANF